YVALFWAVVQSLCLSFLVNRFAENPGPLFIAQVVLALTAGSMFVMWVGELITEHGVGCSEP
ncbi:MAG: preprotein translocase subunit SecY, partial [Microcoleus sp. SIO2G3]|nr:preprotein translocase subunit SecY [Microcoleus sp. SIO2G3]